MTGTINSRQFYIKSPSKSKVFYCQAWENGRLYKEWANGKIRHRYQASIFAVMNLVRELAQVGYKGEIIAHLPDELIAREANDGEEAFKYKEIEELSEIISYSYQEHNIFGRMVRLTRWIYLAQAYKLAKLNGIKLEIKLLEKNNIEIVNSVMSHLLGKGMEKTDQPKR